MVFQVGEMLLQKTQEIFRGKVNDVMVCRDISKSSKVYYTVLFIHDRNIAKKLMNMFHTKNSNARNKFVADFTWKKSYLMVFDYVRERPLERFFSAQISNIDMCEQMGLELTTECLACGLPYPFLYLQLKQGKINLTKSRNIYLTYDVDLEEFSEKITQKDCATLCAQILLKYIEELKKRKTTSHRLLEKKIWKGGYLQFIDLYKDLKLSSQPLKKENLMVKMKQFFYRNQDKFFKMLLTVSVILFSLAFIMLISQLLFSDVPLFKIFINPFKQIGTESLMQ